MDGNKVVCCFCGESLALRDAVVLDVFPSYESEEMQELYCHRMHFAKLIDKSIPLHPDLKGCET